MIAEVLKWSVNITTFAATLRLACPLIIGATGGCFNEKTSTGNIAYECFMLTGAFFGAYGSYLFGSPLYGSLVAMASGVILAAIYGILVYHLNCNAMIVSIAYNSAAWALTTMLLTTVWGVRGTYVDPKIVSYPNITIGLFEKIPFLDTLLNNNIILVYFAFIYAAIGYIIMYKTPFGLRLRGVGINPDASQAAGVSVLKYRWICLLIMGLSMGLAGSYMPLSGLSMFAENMTVGRGFLCLTAILVGGGNPFKVSLVSILFAYAISLTLILSTYGIPTQLMSMLPYVMVLIVLFTSGLKSFKGKADLSTN